MVEQNSISVIVPALNEEENLENAVNVIIEAVEKVFSEYEIIVFNDGSIDHTGEVADKLAARSRNIRVVHHKEPKCLGGVYNEGRKIAAMNYLMLVNGKDDTTVESLNRIFSLRGKYDMVIPYTLNLDERPALRIVSSKIFVWLLNTMCGLNLKYYNHYVLHKRAIVNSIEIQTNSYAFQAEALLKLIKSGYSYVEVGVMDKFKTGGGTKAFRIKHIIEVYLFFIRMFYECCFNKQNGRKISIKVKK